MLVHAEYQFFTTLSPNQSDLRYVLPFYKSICIAIVITYIGAFRYHHIYQIDNLKKLETIYDAC